MQKFNSIEAYRHVIKHVRDNSAYHGKPIPTITFEGTVKLHGTNAGVRVRKDRLQAQSRERLISVTDDNAGFAQFVHNIDRKVWDKLVNTIACVCNNPGNPHNYTLFGEWCGGNIQANSLDKHSARDWYFKFLNSEAFANK